MILLSLHVFFISIGLTILVFLYFDHCRAELFLRGKPYLGYQIKRVRVKGTGVRAASNPEGEPDFYRMPYCYRDGKVCYIDIRPHTVAEPPLIIPREETTAKPTSSDGNKDVPTQDKTEASSCHSDSEPPVLERPSPLLSPEISPPPSPTTMSTKPLSNLDEKRVPIKKRNLAAKSANLSSPKKKTKKTSSHKSVCINPVTMEIIRSTPYSDRSSIANKDDTSSLADFQSTIHPLEAYRVAARSTQEDDGIDEVSFCGCHFHYMRHLGETSVLTGMILLVSSHLCNKRGLSSRSGCPREKHIKQSPCFFSGRFLSKSGDPSRTLTIDILSFLPKISPRSR